MTQQPLPRETMRCQPGANGTLRSAHRGFTLIELVLAIVLVGVLAIYAAPSFNSSDLSARGFHDQTLALLRYAQKSAVAQRRTVCVAFSSTTVSLRIVTASASSDCTTPAASQVLAGAGASSTVTARSGVQFNGGSAPSAFSFDALGQPSAAQVIQVANVTASITVEAVTGYVHD